MKPYIFFLSIVVLFASKKYDNGENDTKDLIVVKIEEDEYVKRKQNSEYIGVNYNEKKSKWRATRWDKDKYKMIYGGYYKSEETAVQASDTLARKLMKNGKKRYKLNFPYDETEVYREEKQPISKYIGVNYNKKRSRWCVQRWSISQNKNVFNGCYDNEVAAAHASDNFARKLMENGKQKLKLNFPKDYTEIDKKNRYTSQYIGVSRNRNKWRAHRQSKQMKKSVYNGSYFNEKTAAHKSDTLARKLMENGEQGHKLNFPDDDIEFQSEKYQEKKRKRQDNLQDN